MAWAIAARGVRLAERVEHHEVVMDAVVADGCDRDPGEPELCGVGLALVAQLELAAVEYLSWVNYDRLHSALGDIPPAEHERPSAPRIWAMARTRQHQTSKPSLR